MSSKRTIRRSRETFTPEPPRSRSELIEAWRYGITAAAPVPPAAPAPDAQADPKVPASPAEADTAVAAAIAAIKTAVAKAKDAQAADPDADDPNDAKVAAGIEAIEALVEKLEANQVADSKDSAGKETAEPSKAVGEPAQAAPPEGGSGATGASTAGADAFATPPGGVPANDPKAVVHGGPDNGNADVPDDEQCSTEGCGHLASSHLNTDAGINTGSCQMASCECSEMTRQDGGQGMAGDSSGPGDDDAPVDADTASTAGAAPFASVAAPPAPAPASGPLDEPVAPPPSLDGVSSPVGGGETPAPGEAAVGTSAEGSETNPDAANSMLDGPRFTIPIGIIEGIKTSDGRQIAPGALTWRTPPLPLMGLRETTEYGHDGAVIVGRIDSIGRSPGANGTEVIWAKGVFDTSEDGLEFARLVEAGMIKGVSADVADVTSEIMVTEADAVTGLPLDVDEMMVAGEIMGMTICPFPAFAGCYIVLGDGEPAKPIEMQQPTAEQQAKAIHVLSTVKCDVCESGVVASAFGGPVAPPLEWFETPEADEPTPLTITDDGRVFGHVAPFGVCHVGISGKCVTAPHSATDYAYFHTGRVVTAEGAVVATGPITMNTDHAGLDRRLSAGSVKAHYDNTGTAIMDVHAIDGEFGIWVSGALRPGVSDEQIRAARASAPSGDWRLIGRGMEMLAVLYTNHPGFPTIRAVTASGEPVALVASYFPNAVETAAVETDETPAWMRPLVEESAAISRRRFAALRGRA